MAPSVIFGLLPRLAGADATLYPTYGGAYALSAEDCRGVADATGRSWKHIKPIFPTAAGRIGTELVGEMCAFYGRELLFIVGSSVQKEGMGLMKACQRFIKEVVRCSKSFPTS
jgi:ribulose-bisphosphate carboxylase large chain